MEPLDDVIVAAAIHPAIGIARLGDSTTEFFIGPEVKEPAPQAPGFYRDASGALKRQAARFRIYGLNAAGKVVGELTSENAAIQIQWTVHLANKKAQWYQFQAALDIPDTATLTVPRRNANIPPPGRSTLAIDPGPRSISGPLISGGPAYTFDTGMFKTTVVPLGEIRTDEAGRLLVLGGFGKSASPSNAPIYTPSDPNTFCNADDWYDDISDGPVTAEVTIAGRAVPVEPAWVIVGPPNYAPDIIGWRTMHDLLTEVFTAAGTLPLPTQVSFTEHVLPILRRLSNLQWVNQGFAAMFGVGGPMNFDDHAFLKKLSHLEPKVGIQRPHDPYRELRRTILNAFRPSTDTVQEPRLWPWLYGDAYGSSTETSPRNALALPDMQAYFLMHWADGDFVSDWNPAARAPATLDEVPPAQRPAMLDAAALHFCLADAFHPGCEMTWTVRHASMFSAPFRIRHRAAWEAERDYGTGMNAAIAMGLDGPLHAQGPGDLTRWMAVPWQADSAGCRSGYDPAYDPYLPTFWAPRVPNQVLTLEDYKIVVDTSQPVEQRLAALNRRTKWFRLLKGSNVDQMDQMVRQFGRLGIVEARPGVKGDPRFPETMFVETLGGQAETLFAAATPEVPASRSQEAGWDDEEQLQQFRSMRVRFVRGK